ncbi:GtrA family protein, partial [Aquibium sp. A9E412]|uniref:GtrA family protein n=1 Tax=Aquibium sp. A9E412 TaxID=2976767 RepID=UPI0025B0E851
MSLSDATFGAAPARRGGLAPDVAAALLLALGALVLQAASGFPTLADAKGDNDSLLRLVQIRDLLAGQAWHDMTQQRLGPDGLAMHWSRVVDLPVAAIIAAATALGAGQAAAETVAAIVWPLGLFAVALLLILRIVRVCGGASALLPAAVVGAAALHATGIFAPGAFDHHNLQLVLTLAMLAGLVQPAATAAAGAAAGAAAALMLAVGMETAPYVAAGGVAAAAGLLAGGRAEVPRAAGFGLAFAATALAVLAATVAPGAWLTVACDAFSFAQAGGAVLAGLGLAAVALLPVARWPWPWRAGALAGLGLALAAAALVLFPQCLGDPYAGLDPRLQRYWLSAVTEAQPLVSVLRNTPEMAASYYGTPLLALGLTAAALWRGGPTRTRLVCGGLLLTAVLVSVWQIRGAMFAIPLATIPLAAWIGRLRAQAAARPTPGATLKMAGAWLASVAVVWNVSAAALAGVLRAPEADTADVAAAA